MVLIEYVPYGDLLRYLRKSRGLYDTYFQDPDIKPTTNLTSKQLMKFVWQMECHICHRYQQARTPYLVSGMLYWSNFFSIFVRFFWTP